MGEDLKARLLAGNTKAVEATEAVDTWAGPVTVRGLTRSETMMLNKGRELGSLDMASYERKMVSLCLLDPVMTEDEVGQWQKVDIAGGDLEPVTDKISELSGLKKGADKSGVPATGE